MDRTSERPVVLRNRKALGAAIGGTVVFIISMVMVGQMFGTHPHVKPFAVFVAAVSFFVITAVFGVWIAARMSMLKIEVRQDSVKIVQTFSTKYIPRSDIVDVVPGNYTGLADKGHPVNLVLKDGRKINVPALSCRDDDHVQMDDLKIALALPTPAS